MKNNVIIHVFSLVVMLLSSCSSSKEFAYFQNTGDSVVDIQADTVDALIRRNDILKILVTSRNAEASSDFNLNDNNLSGYLVDNAGNVQMPILGSVKAAGLTKSQLKENITKMIIASKLLLEPIVEIRYMNFEVTVIGEVSRPTVITVPSEQITIVKALGLAGDLTIYGKRKNVLLIREEDGKRITKRIDLTSSEVINSPYYYLRPNDVVYIEPNRNRIASSDKFWLVVPAVISALTLMVITYNTFVQ